MSNKKAFRCKNIYTACNPNLLDGYVIIEGNKIVAVGTEKEICAQGDLLSDAEIYSYDDNFIMPGFNDFHTHLLIGAMLDQDGILRYTKSEDDAAKFLWDKHKDNKEKKWILGGAWDRVFWKSEDWPTKKTLDKYFPETPVFLVNHECHGAWANSKLFEIFGVTKDTPDPVNGFYSRNEQGEPNGYVHEAAFVEIQNKIFSLISDREMAEYAIASVHHANKYGITTVGDVPGVGPLRESAYEILNDEGMLTLRINFYAFLEEGIDRVREKILKYTSQKLKCCGAKTFIDGTPLGHSGFMLDDYSDMPGCKSNPLWNIEKFIQTVEECDKDDIQVRVHACGDGGVRLALDAYELARQANGVKDMRHCIEHIECISPDDIGRFAELGVIASVQPEHMPKYNFFSHPFHKILGEERMKYCWPFGSLQRSGAHLAFGTDYPVVDINPLRGIFRAVNRLTNEGEPKGGWIPDERISIHDALRAYTFGGAYAARRENELGTLEVGKLADIVVVEKNLFQYALNRAAMFDMKVLLTVMDGEIVYRLE